jgi:hypothetical protein
MSAYAHFHADCEVVSKPALDDLVEVVTRSARRGLLIIDYEWDSLEPLARVPSLEILKIQTPGRLKSLSGIGGLTALRVLLIAPPPSWDGSGRRIEVESFRPLQALRRLEQLQLLSVRPADLDLTPIASMRHLKDVHIAGVPEFTLEDYAKLAAALPNATGRSLQPYVAVNGVGFCRRCRGRTVLLPVRRRARGAGCVRRATRPGWRSTSNSGSGAKRRRRLGDT